MSADSSDGREVFIRQLVNDVAPAEAPLVPDYIAAVDAAKAKSVDGLEFGIEGFVEALGPLVVLVSTTLFTDLGKWALSGTEEAIKTLIKQGGQRLLAAWLGAPKKGGLKDVLTDQGKSELLAMVRASLKGKKIEKEKIDKIMAALEKRLFET
ncbi:hypothetical protein ACKWRH_10865 [Bradyrhizobium sp. Pa8]|uniref:hypothetical protein n=1 Tax=Bradyrhizobium sp. Pa8 TaxID=3386552 RepID=UPI00403F5DA6